MASMEIRGGVCDMSVERGLFGDRASCGLEGICDGPVVGQFRRPLHSYDSDARLHEERGLFSPYTEDQVRACGSLTIGDITGQLPGTAVFISMGDKKSMGLVTPENGDTTALVLPQGTFGVSDPESGFALLHVLGMPTEGSARVAGSLNNR